MATVVGFTWPPYHDTSVSVVVDGRLVFATEEERYTRHKHSVCEWPINSMIAALRYLSNSFSIKPEDIDAFAINYDPDRYTKDGKKYAANLIMNQVGALRLGSYTTAPIGFFDELMDRQLSSNCNFTVSARAYLEHVFWRLGKQLNRKTKIHPVSHHLAHAASAYYFSGFKSSAVVVADAKGEDSATTIWRAKKGEFEKLMDIHWKNGSLGTIYDGVSLLLKFGLREGAGKVMGLAPYGKKDRGIELRLDKVIKIPGSNVPYSLVTELKGQNYYEEYKAMMLSALGSIDLKSWDSSARRMSATAANLARCTQKRIEDAMLSTVRYAKDLSGEKHLALAGGVALNAKANMEIYYSGMFDDVFIFPAADDAGTSSGAAAYVYEHVVGGRMAHEALRNVYLGPSYSDKHVKGIVSRSKFAASYIGDDVGELSRLVSDGKIIALYQGRAEFGPRALGNRSIVADPRNKRAWKLVNELKDREWWRPLASSVLLKYMAGYFEKPTNHKYMVLMLNMKKDAARRAQATCHVDMTSRLQAVQMEDNRVWYDLIDGFRERTGEALVLNTSFNVGGEPLVETPDEALKNFACSGIDALYLQGWLFKKNG